MKLTYFPFSLAALSFALILPSGLKAQSGTVGSSPAQTVAADEASHMVSARASLSDSIDARKLTPGAKVSATLAHKVTLQNGTELPYGTVLTGDVTSDATSTGGSQLALRFNQAVLKSGETIPVKATITRMYSPEAIEQAGDSKQFSPAPAAQLPNTWTDDTLDITQIGVNSGVDLHSRIASNNSGTLTSSHKDIKLPAGSEIAFAISSPSQPSSTITTGR